MTSKARYARRRLTSVLACGAAVLALIGGMASAAVAAPPDGDGATPAPTTAKIKPKLRAKLETGSRTDFWVRFQARADLAAASRIADWNERGTKVAEALRKTARRSQSGVRAKLDSAGVSYQAFWATNAIYVRQGSTALAADLAGQLEVESLYPTTTYSVPDAVQGQAVQAVDGVEWGVASINADDVWEQYGVTGAGITVASIDTGVQYDHPALVRQYRGNLGDGTFDHNYNWFDAAGKCHDAPCDTNTHGTHTMGTMAGDDGAANHIGVAPGVKWIAANGCCPDDAALVASGQWMLQPTDLNGEHPDASKRPNIINNSWGTQEPSNDPFMDDVTQAWAASGIFGVWSNGNNAPGCKTSGSPGSLAGNYSAGAYDVDNKIGSFSSRGSGQDGETKPNISAPGVNVRSSVPGNKYGYNSGTSMAAPHVAGAVALLWSAAPTLIGDVQTTKELLDGTATDSPDDECGGTADDNNVYGEGRLDALKLVDSAPVSDAGALTVKVTDGRTPIGGATVHIAGPDTRERVTAPDGVASLALRTGDYTVSVSAFGYPTQTAHLTITAGTTTTQTFSLKALPTAKVSGRVTDGSGHGWPLYAKITVDGAPGLAFYTRPDDGQYSFSLPEDATYTLKVESQYGGYQPVSRQVAVGHKDITQDVAVPVDVKSCTAAGYRVAYDGVSSDFASGLPDGWTVDDNLGNGEVWRFDDPGKRTNKTGGAGGFAIADSWFYDYGGQQDTSLVTPVADLSGQSSPVIGFKQDYYKSTTDAASVDLSVDGGATWETVLQLVNRVAGPRTESIPIPQAANQPDVRVRFRYLGSFSNWWQVDDAFVGTPLCVPVDGGLVLGQVRDRNTGDAVNGVLVANDDNPKESSRTVATPRDPGIDDGFYWMFSAGAGARRYTASVDSYTPQTKPGTVTASGVTAVDFDLAAGQLSIKHDDMSANAMLGQSAKRTFTVTNTGSAPATVEFAERRGTFEIRRADGSTVSEAQLAASAGAEVVRIPGDFSPLAFTGDPAAAGTDAARSDPPAAGWIGLPDYPTSIMDNAVGELDGRVYSVSGVDGHNPTAKGYVYDPAVGSWQPIADLPGARENAAGAFVGDTFYVTGGWDFGTRAVKTTFAYDPAANSWRSVADAPVATAAAGRAVLNGQLYVIGGCTNACDGTDVQRYDPATNTWQLMASYPMPAGHLACAGLAGKVYCAGGIRRGGTIWKATYAYDPAADTWTKRADMPIELWGMGYTGSYDRLLVSGGITGGAITNEGFAYDPGTDSWTRLPAARNVTYRGGSTCGFNRIGGSFVNGFNPVAKAELLPTYGACVPAEVPWMSLDTGRVALAPGDKVKVTVELSAGVAQPGVYTAGVWIKEDTPYLVDPLDVTMTVKP
jgi:subtilisin family serine protease/N-acetylneuraminic acid mutarotase